MTIDPAHRLTSAQVVQHAWMKSPISRESRNGGTAGNIDFELLHAICRKYQYTYREIYDSVIDNKCNYFSAIYHVTLAARGRDGDARTGEATLGKPVVFNLSGTYKWEWDSETSDTGVINNEETD